MRRISGDTVAQNLFGAGLDGFQPGNAETQTPATIVTAEWLNAVQEEIARAVIVSGQELDPNNFFQLTQAIQILAAQVVPPAPPASDPTTLLARVNEWIAEQTVNAPITFKGLTRIDGVANYLRSVTLRTHTKFLPLTAVNIYSTYGDVQDEGVRMYNAIGQSYTGVAKLDLSAFLPRGANITGISAGVHTSQLGGGSARMNMVMQRFTPVLSGDSGPNAQQQLFSVTASKGGDTILTSPPMSVTVTDTLPLRLTWTGSTVAQFSDPDYVRWVRVQYAGYFANEYL